MRDNKDLIVYDMEQGTPEWFAVRMGVCTGSEAATGLMAAKRGYETYLIQKESELHLQFVEPGYESSDMKRGKELEPLALARFEHDELKETELYGFILNKKLNAGCSPDAWIPSEKAGVEIKCLNSTNHYRAFKTGIDKKEYAQVMHAMAVTGAKKWYIVHFHPDFKPDYQLHVEVIDAEEDVIKTIKILLMDVKNKIGR